ncbi:MAG: pyridoxal-phosphate dependent enzyme, partial [Candidatus Thiodiazotropha sp. (ex Lucinoma annulata)]|nr:pyridoxal-phosphate dependent enzyme [Candidatus Thiodiazotropha sp. (ex Lucinoma annulata)]
MPQRYIEKILRARVYDVAKETPLDKVNLLSARLDNQIFLKREDLQPVFSFKLRGAYNKMVNLSDDVKKQGVIAASAGNHAQGVALAAKKLKIQALIVMPKTTPPIKVQSVKNLGAKIILAGDSYDEAYTRSQLIAQEKNLTFI